MVVYDYIVVGGGISGMYMTYKLQETGNKILLVEGSNRLGGRIFTDQEKGLSMEMGAGRISEKHHKVMSLIRELDLDKELLELPKDIQYKVSGPRVDFYGLINELYSEKKHYSKQYLETVSLLQYAIDVLGYKLAKVLQYQLGYDAEFQYLNAYHALKAHKHDLFSDNAYYIVKSGLSSLVKGLETRFKDNVSVQLDTFVTDIGERYIRVGDKKYHGKYIFLCVPQKTLQSLSLFETIPQVSKVKSIPLIRIYAQYPKDKSGKVWFHKLKRTITDNYIRHIIPISVEQGLLMISYTDSLYADMWNQLSKMTQSQLVSHLHKEIKTVLGIEPPKPIFVKSHYWSEGIHMWNPGCSVAKEYQTMLKPFDTRDIFVINESYSLHQGWIEGCLDMCYDVLDQLPDFSRTRIKGGKSNKPKVKLYSFNQVLKHRNWIILDLRGKLRIYDVGKWMQKHPGGRDNLKRGIKANRFYKPNKTKEDKQSYPQSPIQLFRSIPSHHSGKVIQTMLFQENPFVKFVGFCKKV